MKRPNKSRRTNEGSGNCQSFSPVLQALRFTSPHGAYGDYAMFQANRTPMKTAAESWRKSARQRNKPITLATKPFNHREGDA